MGARSKRNEKIQQASSSTTDKTIDDGLCVIVRDVNDGSLHMVNRNQISSKKSNKGDVGDAVFFQNGDARSEGIVLLIGTADWFMLCTQLLRI